MPSPVPFALVVKNGSKICSPLLHSGPARYLVPRHATPAARPAGVGAGDVTHYRVRAGGEGVVEGVAEDLSQAEGVRRAGQVYPAVLLGQAGVSSGGLAQSLTPRVAPDRGQVAAAAVELDGGSVGPDVLE